MYFQKLENLIMNKFKKLSVYKNNSMIKTPKALINQIKAQLYLLKVKEVNHKFQKQVMKVLNKK